MFIYLPRGLINKQILVCKSRYKSGGNTVRTATHKHFQCFEGFKGQNRGHLPPFLLDFFNKYYYRNNHN